MSIPQQTTPSLGVLDDFPFALVSEQRELGITTDKRRKTDQRLREARTATSRQPAAETARHRADHTALLELYVEDFLILEPQLVRCAVGRAEFTAGEEVDLRRVQTLGAAVLETRSTSSCPRDASRRLH